MIERLPRLFSWQSYTLTACGQVVDEHTTLYEVFGVCPATGSLDPLQLTAVKSEVEDAHIDMHMALVGAAHQLDSSTLRKLVQSGASTDSCKTALLEVIKANPLEHSIAKSPADVQSLRKWKLAVQTLLATKPDMNAACPNQKTFFDMLLPMALQDAALLRACLNAGADANAHHVQDVGSMHAAIRASGPLLYLAARAGEVSIAKELLAAGAEVEAVGSELHSECEMKHAKETSLHVACATGNMNMAALLLTSRANVNSVRRRADLEAGNLVLVKESALHVALQAKRHDLVTLLVTSRADSSCRQLWGDAEKTALELCDGDVKLLKALRLH